MVCHLRRKMEHVVNGDFVSVETFKAQWSGTSVQSGQSILGKPCWEHHLSIVFKK